MSILIPKTELKNAVTLLKRVIDMRVSIPILTCVRFRVCSDDDAVIIEGGNLEERLQCRVSANTVQATSDFIIAIKDLAEIIKPPGKDDVRFDPDRVPGSVVVGVIAGNSMIERRIDSFCADDWFELEVPEEVSVKATVSAGFFDLFRKAAEITSNDATRLTMQHVCMDNENLAAGDGRVQGMFIHGIPDLDVPDGLKIRPTKLLTVKGAFSSEATLSAYGKEQPTLCRIETPELTYTIKLHDGAYPNYRQVFRSASLEDRKITVASEKLSALRQTLNQFHIEDTQYTPVFVLVANGALYIIGEGANPETIQVDGATVVGPSQPVFASVNRRLLGYALEHGFTTIRIESDIKTIVATSSEGCVTFMSMHGHNRTVNDLLPLVGLPPIDETQTDHPTEEPNMPENTDSETTNTKPNLTMTEKPEQEDPFDSLLNYTNDLAEKAKELNLMARELPRKIRATKADLRQKDKAFAQARQVLDQLQKVAGF